MYVRSHRSPLLTLAVAIAVAILPSKKSSAECPAFAPPANYNTQNGEAVVSGDFNGDAIPDLAVGSMDYLEILLGRGDGTFATGEIYGYAASGTKRIAAGDLNGDGIIDLALISSPNGTIVAILIGKGDGTFTFGPTYSLGVGSVWAVTLGDFNGDRTLDLAVTNVGSNYISIYLGNGDGSFSQPKTYVVGSAPFSIATADFNGDGKLDLAVGNKSSNDVSVLLGNGDGTFGPATNYVVGSVGDHRMVAAGDFNQDGKIDLVATNEHSNTVSILMGKGDGTFMPPVDYPTRSAPFPVVIADMNGDGIPDLVVGEFSGAAAVSILMGKGDGSFTLSGSYGVAGSPYFLTVADFNADGKPDIASIGENNSNTSVLLNVGTCNSLPPPLITFIATPTSISTGETATLSWTVSNANTVSIDHGLGVEPITGSVVVAPSSTTRYLLTASGVGGTLSKQVTVVVTVPSPVITTFVANPPSIAPGQSTTLSWSVINASTVTIDNGVGTQPLVGSVSVAPTVTTVYTLTASGVGGTASKQVTVALPPPVINTFAATPASITSGQPSTLTWSVTNASTVTIDHGVGAQPVAGTIVVTPTVTTVYTLTASGIGGTATKQVTIAVSPLPPSITFGATPSVILRGQVSTLSWTVMNANTVTIDHGVGAQPLVATVLIAPLLTTTYTLTATGAGGTATAQATIYIAPGRRRAVGR